MDGNDDIPEGSQRYKWLEPEVFSFYDPQSPCDYWQTFGTHVVSKGECRCGKKFALLEQI